MNESPLPPNSPLPTFSSGAGWRDRVHLGLWCAGILGQHSVGCEASPFSEIDFLNFLNNLVVERESRSPSVRDSLATFSGSVPDISKQAEYCVVTLNAMSEGGTAISMPFGGIAFEDPFWAVLAARNIACGHSLAVLPVASGSEELWSRSVLRCNTLEKIECDDPTFFAEAVRFIPPESKPIFALRRVEGSRLELLRQKGRCVLPQASAGAVFQLYAPPA